MAEQTVVLYHNYDQEKIKALENDPNKKIISKKTDIYDTLYMMPLHMEPHPSFLMYRTTYVYVNISPKQQSPRQDATSAAKAGQGPKTRGDTDEFIRAFWINGKPKCRRGYRYDFRRKMCRLIK